MERETRWRNDAGGRLAKGPAPSGRRSPATQAGFRRYTAIRVFNRNRRGYCPGARLVR